MANDKRKYDTITSIKVNGDKKDRAKAMGLNLQDILDEALDNYLGLSIYDELNKLEIEKSDLEKELENLEKDKAEAIKKTTKEYDNQIKSIQLKLKIIENKIAESGDPFGEEFEKEKELAFNRLFSEFKDVNGNITNANFIESLNDYFKKFGITSEDQQNETVDNLIKNYNKDVYGVKK